MIKHSKTISDKESLSKLAEEIGDLHYESLAEFLGHLATKLEKDSKADGERNRKKLSESLMFASNDIKMAKTNINKAWIISEPYMK